MYDVNSQEPQTPEELRKMLHSGIGRAVLFLLKQDLSRYRDLILDCCLHNYAYDTQVEQTHAEYLYPLITASGEEDYYRREILSALLDSREPADVEQLLDFAVNFARDGWQDAQRAIYEKLRKNDTDEPLQGTDQIIELDGVRGLILLLDLIGADPHLLERYKDDFLLVEKAERGSSVGEVKAALKEAARAKPNVATSIANVAGMYSPDWTDEEIVRKREEWRGMSKEQTKDRERKRSWEEIKDSPEFARLVLSWSRLASPKEFAKAAAELDPQDEPERLRSHLWIFWRRPFPLDPRPLIQLVDHPNDRVAVAALSDLGLVPHPEVRKLFNRLLQDPKWSDRAIGLLRSNYRTGDDKTILRLLKRETDPDKLHITCIDIMHVYRDNPVPEGMEPLLLVYEETPCSLCRCTCVETIRTIGTVPDGMIEECLYDAYSGTKALAEKLKHERGRPDV